MPINLVKGQNHVLNMNIFHVGLGWDVNEGASPYPFDLDVSAFMIGANKKILNDDFLVYYNSEHRVLPSNLTRFEPFSASKYPPYTDTQGCYHLADMHWKEETRPVSPEFSVIGSIDDQDGSTSEDGDDEIMDIDLSKVSNDIQEIVITVSIYDYQNRKQNFGQVERAYVRLYKQGQETEGQEDFRYDLNEDFSICASIEFCRLYRYKGEWKIQATGIGHHGGLEELVEKYR